MEKIEVERVPKTHELCKTEPLPSDKIFDELYQALHEYRCGRIVFLELLEIWKAILNLPLNNT